MLRRVWIDGWQMQCCGESFRVNEYVELSTSAEVDREFLGVVLGEESAAALTDYEDHHDLDVAPMTPLAGQVETIEAVSCRYVQQDRVMLPVPGTTHVVVKDEATGWEPEDDGHGLRFVGYVVTVRTG
ncbi:MAG TPA: DUF6578 domain-containing protein [Acidimicrobiales bacterium]|nr:DUF6578 domain-containing protein [Acidimicrobiales bacterium]